MAEDPIPLDADDSDDPRLTNPAAARRPEDEDEIDLTEESPADADPDVTSANLHLGSSTLDNASLAAEDRSAAPGADAVDPAATGTLAQGIGSETNSLGRGAGWRAIRPATRRRLVWVRSPDRRWKIPVSRLASSRRCRRLRVQARQGQQIQWTRQPLVP